jgi:hypothetical protein
VATLQILFHYFSLPLLLSAALCSARAQFLENTFLLYLKFYPLQNEGPFWSILEINFPCVRACICASKLPPFQFLAQTTDFHKSCFEHPAAGDTSTLTNSY